MMMLDRQEFFAMMSEAVAATAGADLVGGRIPPGRAKTRILEAHAPESSSDGVALLIRALEERSGLRAELVGDELWWLTGGAMVGFLDTLNPRFWQLHSTSPAGEVARVVRAVVGSDPRLDTAWLPKSLLRDLDGEHLWVKWLSRPMSYLAPTCLLGVGARGSRATRPRACWTCCVTPSTNEPPRSRDSARSCVSPVSARRS